MLWRAGLAGLLVLLGVGPAASSAQSNHRCQADLSCTGDPFTVGDALVSGPTPIEGAGSDGGINATTVCPTSTTCFRKYSHMDRPRGVLARSVETADSPLGQTWEILSTFPGNAGHLNCPTERLCVSVRSGAKGLLTARISDSGNVTWSASAIVYQGDTRKLVLDGYGVRALSCPTGTSGCVIAVNHYVMRSRDVTRRGVWTLVHTGIASSYADIPMSCPSARACFLQARGKIGWVRWRSRGPQVGRVRLSPVPGGVSRDLECATERFCVLLTDRGRYTTGAPTRGPGAWRHQRSGIRNGRVACTGPDFCVVTGDDRARDAVIEVGTDFGRSWTRSPGNDSVTYGRFACWAPFYCVGAEDNANLVLTRRH